MGRCTAPKRGHRSERARRDCPECGSQPPQQQTPPLPLIPHSARVRRLANPSPVSPSSNLPVKQIQLGTHTPTSGCFTVDLAISRTQWAAGAGFFHSCTINTNDRRFTFVYDCGTARKFSILQSEIDLFLKSINSSWQDSKYMKRNFTFFGTPFKDEWNASSPTTTPTIDTVFISHFDIDHIKGLSYLIQKAKVKELVIPYTTPEERFLYLATSQQARSSATDRTDDTPIDDFIIKFTANPEDAVNELYREMGTDRRETRVITVSSDSQNGRPNYVRQISVNANSLSNNQHFKSQDVSIWTIAAHTLSNNAQSYGNKLINELTNRGIISTRDDLTDPHTLRKIFSVKSSISEITKAYRTIVGRNLNKTSLILYSGPSQPLNTQTSDHIFWTEKSTGNATNSTFPSPILIYNFPHQAGWLGCGDAPLSSATNLSKFDSLFGDHKLFASTFAPPHHGSLRDWNIQLLDSFGYPKEISPVCVISADGLHQHPDPYVISDIYSRGSIPFIVTTDTRSRLTETMITNVSCNLP